MSELENQNRISIAEMSSDIKYLRTTVQEMKAMLDVMNKNVVNRSEMESRFTRIQTEIDKRFEGANARIDKKVDKEDFEPYKALFWKVAGSITVIATGGAIAASTLVKNIN